MSAQPQLFDEGARLADEGIARSVDHADRIELQWSDRAAIALGKFMDGRAEITIEEAKDWAYVNGLPKPPAPGAWGSVTRRAIKAGRIEFLRFETSKNATQHQKPVRVWRVR